MRPTIRGYRYLNKRLSSIKKEVKYPREDAIELKNKVDTLNTAVEKIETLLDTKNPDSLVSKQQQATQEIQSRLAHQKALLEEYQAKNAIEHEKLSQEAKSADSVSWHCVIAQLSEDSQFLGQVREIIRFVRTA